MLAAPAALRCLPPDASRGYAKPSPRAALQAPSLFNRQEGEPRLPESPYNGPVVTDGCKPQPPWPFGTPEEQGRWYQTGQPMTVEVTLCGIVPPGQYVVLPHTLDASMEAAFHLEVSSKDDHDFTLKPRPRPDLYR